MRAAVLTVLVCLLGPVPAVATVRLDSTLIGRSPQVLGTDGDRFAAWRTPDNEATTVYDTTTQQTRLIEDPAGCETPRIGFRALLYACGGDESARLLPAARVVNLISGEQREVVPPQRMLTGPETRIWAAVGSHWLQSIDSGYHFGGVSSFYSRATGERYMGPEPFGRSTQPDLGRPGLARSVCAPVMLRAVPDDPYDNQDPFEPVLLAGHWTLQLPPAFSSGTTPVVSLVLRQCGSRVSRLLCRGLCEAPLLTSRVAVWQDKMGLHSLQLRDGRRTSYTGPRVQAAWRLGGRVLLATRSTGVRLATIR